MFRNNPEFMNNPYVGGFTHSGGTVFLIMSEKGNPLYYNDTVAAFATGQDAVNAYRSYIYRGKKDRTKAYIQVVNFGNMAKYPNIEAKVAEAVYGEGLKILSVDEFGRIHQQHVSAKGTRTKSISGGRALKAKSGANTYMQARFIAWNYAPAKGGFGADVARAYTSAAPANRFDTFLQKTGISLEQVNKAMEFFGKNGGFEKGVPTATKRDLAVRAAQHAGFSYSPPPAKGRGRRGAAASAPTGIPMPGAGGTRTSRGGIPINLPGSPGARSNPNYLTLGEDYGFEGDDFGFDGDED
jgi:hypothetical protein